MFEERDPEARLLVVNRGDHAYIAERLDAAGIAASKVEILQADHKDVPALVSQMSVGTALRKPQYSQLACAPTKLAEYLGCGIPCLANYRVGDVEHIVEGNHVGVVLNGFSEEEMRQGVDRTLALLSDPGLRERCVATARRLFALEDGAAAYMAVYRKLTQQPCADRATL
jgi:glycosyltransferase involved in cell wall biosynthesis